MWGLIHLCNAGGFYHLPFFKAQPSGNTVFYSHGKRKSHPFFSTYNTACGSFYNNDKTMLYV